MVKAKKRAPLFLMYRKIAIGFVALTVLLIGAVVMFSLMSARVEITPRKMLQSVEFLVGVGSGAEGETIPGILEERVVEGDVQVEATGVKTSEGKATGMLTVMSTMEFPQPLVATTRFLTPDGVLFRLKNQVTVPAKGSVEAEVYADIGGASGNINPSTFTIPGLTVAKQKLVWAESKAAMTGGAKTARVISAEDIARGKAQVVKQLEDEAIARFAQEVEGQYGGVVGKATASSAEISAKVGEEKQSFSIHAKVTLALVAYDRSALETSSKTRLLISVPQDKELSYFGKDAMLISLESFDSKNARATLRIYADGDAVLKKTSGVLNMDKLAGMGVEEATRYLQSFEAVEKARITVFPAWLKSIPTLKDHIDIIIKK
ncbi:MAG: hypothetical protein AAB444_01690 [Patescibacteria group bacterium]